MPGRLVRLAKSGNRMAGRCNCIGISYQRTEKDASIASKYSLKSSIYCFQIKQTYYIAPHMRGAANSPVAKNEGQIDG